MDDKEAVKIIEKCIWDWKSLHSEMNGVVQYLKNKNQEAYKIVCEIADVEDRLVERAFNEFSPRLEKLKEVLFRKSKIENK